MTVAGVCATESVFAAAPKPVAAVKKSFGLQIYSLGGELAADVPEGLKKVAQMGYSYIELAGYNAEGKIGAVPIAEFKKYADDAGLKIVSTHVNPPMNAYNRSNLEQIKEFWKKTAEHHAAIGCKYIVQPGQPQIRSTQDAAFVGEVFNEAGKIAKAAGLTFGYHNHDGEFARVVPRGSQALPSGRWPYGALPEGVKIIYDAMLEATDPSLVVFENDVYWTVMGQQDPVAYMKKHADRIRLLHIKDIAVLGESGMMNFQKIFETAYSIGINDFYVEYENFAAGDLFGNVKKCADYLNNANFVK
jgi:sugar phosphate isomerase/epimerase